MKRFALRIFLPFVVFATLISFHQNCSDVRLHRIVEPPQVFVDKAVAQLCLAPPDQDVLYSKIIFIVDQSGSNGQNDPNAQQRAGSIASFINQYATDPYYKWGLIGFKEANGIVYTTDNAGDPDIVDSATVLQELTQNIRPNQDGGCTPYIPALMQAKRMIQIDLERHPEENAVYNIFFLSDGFPRLVTPQNPCLEATVQDNPNDPFLFAVDDLRSLDSDQIFLSTIYYTPANNDPGRGAAAGLGYMAREGGGTFTDVTNGGMIQFKEIKVGELTKPWLIKNTKIVSYNLNSGFCDDGSIDVDSDSDGLCDKDEERYNNVFSARLAEKYPGKKFSAQDRHSLDPDYSDSFIWKFNLLPTGAGLFPCNNKFEDEDFDLLNSCEEGMIRDAAANGPTPQWTEELVVRGGSSASRTNYDSDGDGFLDMIELFAFRLAGSFSASVNYQSIFQFYTGGVRAEEVLYHHRHFMKPEANPDVVYDTRTELTGVNEEGQYCYTFQQDVLPLYPTRSVSSVQANGLTQIEHQENENVILLYFIATKEDDPNGKGVLFHSYQKAIYEPETPGVVKLDLTFENFEQYKAK